MFWRKSRIENACALALLAVAGLVFAQTATDPLNPTSPPGQTSPATPDGPANTVSPAAPNQPDQLGPASTLDQPIAPDVAGEMTRTDQSGQTQRPDTLTQPAQPSQPGQGGEPSQRTWNELRGKIIDLRQIGVEGTSTPNTIVLLETEDGQRVAIDLGVEGALSGATLRMGDTARIKGVMVSVDGNPVFIARELEMGGQTWQVTRPQTDRFSQLDDSEAAQLRGTVQHFDDVDVHGGVKNRVALIQTADGRRMLVDLGPVSALQSIPLNRGDQVTISGHNAWVSGDRSVFFADQVNVGGRTLEVERAPFDPGSQESGGQSSQPSTSPAQPDQTQPDHVQPTEPGPVHSQPGQAAEPPAGTGSEPGTQGTEGSQGAPGASSPNANDL